MWDVVNEAVIMPIFDRYDNGITRICKELGRIELIRTVFETARATDPTAILLLNDFDVSPAYDILVEGCLEAGIPIDAIGIQSHMHQGYWGVDETHRPRPVRALQEADPFHREHARFRPAHAAGDRRSQRLSVSEWPSTPEGEERQAQEVVSHYKTLMAHPLVEGITWWDLSDGGWLNAPAGLLRQGSHAQARLRRILKLIKGEWWLAPRK